MSLTQQPLTKISRYGNTFEVVKFEKPLLRPDKPRVNFTKRRKGSSTIKLTKNIWRIKRRIRKHVEVLNYQLGHPAFVTFTYENQTAEIAKVLKDWTAFVRRIKTQLPKVALLRVPERHKSGKWHFHAVMYGLPQDNPCIYQLRGRYRTHACPSKAQCERRTRLLAKTWRHGFVDCERVRSTHSIGAYMSKYLTKGEPDWELFNLQVATSNDVAKNAIADARNSGTFFELSSYRNPIGVRDVIADYQEILVPRLEREFDTQWLGKARYTLYSLDSPPRVLDE